MERSGNFDVQLVSLATSAWDDNSLNITRPTSWLKGVREQSVYWQGRPVSRVGAFASEFEFQRYRPRPILADLLMDSDIIQVVCGSPAWALSVCDLGKPVAVH